MKNPELIRNLPIFVSVLIGRAIRSVREMTIAESIETKIPIPSTSANPFTSEVPNQKSMTAAIKLVMFASRIASHARPKPSPIAFSLFFPSLSSSLMRSAISTFASTASPTERMSPAIPAAVRTTGMSWKSASIKIT